MRVLPDPRTQKPSFWFVFVLFLLGIFFFLPGLGASHLFDWDEINFAEASREMFVTGDYLRVQIDFQPFWEKPPLFFWLQLISYHLFGVTEFAARFPNAVIGILTLITVFFVGKRLQNATFGWLWALSFFGSILPFFYFRSGLIDPLFNLLIFLSISFIAFYYLEKKLLWLALAGTLCGLGVLSKGPVALLMVGITWGALYFSYVKSLRFPWKEALLFLLCCFITSASWLFIEWSRHGSGLLQQFWTYQSRLLTVHDAGHKGFPGYHIVVLLLGCFPASIFCVDQLLNKKSLPAAQSFYRSWMQILLFAVIIVFTIVKTKILHYSSLAYFPLTYMAALFFHDKISSSESSKDPVGVNLIGFTVLGVIASMILFAIPLLMAHPNAILHLIKDPFAKANLTDASQWTGWEHLIGVFYLLVVVAAAYRMTKKEWLTLFHLQTVGTALVVFLFTTFVLPKIEQATQGSAIQFYQWTQNKTAYVEPYGFKSYAHLFYSKKTPEMNTAIAEIHKKSGGYKDWLLSGKTDLPVYFVARSTSLKDFENNRHFKKIFEKNGYALLESLPKK